MRALLLNAKSPGVGGEITHKYLNIKIEMLSTFLSSFLWFQTLSLLFTIIALDRDQGIDLSLLTMVQSLDISWLVRTNI